MQAVSPALWRMCPLGQRAIILLLKLVRIFQELKWSQNFFPVEWDFSPSLPNIPDSHFKEGDILVAGIS